MLRIVSSDVEQEAYTTLPDAVLFNPSLPASAIRVYALIDRSESVPSASNLAAQLGVAGHTVYRAERLLRAAGVPLPERERRAPVGHGETCHHYTNNGCRCDPCRAAWAAYMRRRKQERKEALRRGEVAPPHGAASTYTNYGCRCDECRAAYTASRRRPVAS